MSDTLKRAHAIQAELETLLHLDADSEVTGGIDESEDPPAVCVMLTEDAARAVVAALRKAKAS